MKGFFYLFSLLIALLISIYSSLISVSKFTTANNSFPIFESEEATSNNTSLGFVLRKWLFLTITPASLVRSSLCLFEFVYILKFLYLNGSFDDSLDYSHYSSFDDNLLWCFRLFPSVFVLISHCCLGYCISKLFYTLFGNEETIGKKVVVLYLIFSTIFILGSFVFLLFYFFDTEDQIIYSKNNIDENEIIIDNSNMDVLENNSNNTPNLILSSYFLIAFSFFLLFYLSFHTIGLVITMSRSISNNPIEVILRLFLLYVLSSFSILLRTSYYIFIIIFSNKKYLTIHNLLFYFGKYDYFIIIFSEIICLLLELLLVTNDLSNIEEFIRKSLKFRSRKKMNTKYEIINSTSNTESTSLWNKFINFFKINNNTKSNINSQSETLNLLSKKSSNSYQSI